MPAFTLSGGPCHFDIMIRYYIFLGKRYADNKIGNLAQAGARQKVRRHSRDFKGRFEKAFDTFFNPDKADGDWFLYNVSPCCSFHIDMEITIPPTEWGLLNEQQIRQRLPQNTGMIVVEDITMNDNPRASIGGEKLLMGASSDGYTFVHEVGHNLGLADQYIVPPIPSLNIPGNGMTEAEERRHIGHMMGKKARRNPKRVLDIHEIGDIATAVGITCDADVCCPDKSREGEREPVEQSGLEVPQFGESEAPYPIGDGHFENTGIACGPSYFPAHTGAVAEFDLAADMLGPALLERYLLPPQAELR